MAAAVSALSPLLELLLADLRRSSDEPGLSPLCWAMGEGPHPGTADWRQTLRQHHGEPVLRLRLPVVDLNAQLSALGNTGAGPVQLVILPWHASTPGGLPTKQPRRTKTSPLLPAPAVVVQGLPQHPWILARLRSQRRLRYWSRQGYDCLASTPSAALLRHRRFRQRSSGETTAAKPHLQIRSVDFWDTLITRWDPDPGTVFDYMASLAGLVNFRQQRIAAERLARHRHGEYTLEDIYGALQEISDLPLARCQELMALELEAERAFAQPVQTTIDQLGASDVVISDMYLSADQMRAIARPHVNLDRQPFLVSAGGKHQGAVWRKLRQAGIEARHSGDNYLADYVRAAQRDHQVSLVRTTRFSPLEQRFAQAGLNGLANLMRLQRLASPEAGLLELQRRLNLPLLYLTALDLIHRVHREDGPSQLLFCSRDCAYLHGMYQAMATAQQRFAPQWAHQGGGVPPPHTYYFTSRIAKRGASQGYQAYTRSLLLNSPSEAQLPLLVDVQGSGRSSHHFFHRVLQRPVRQLFIYASGDAAPGYGAESLLSKAVVRELLPKASDLLEVLNYSADLSLLDMHAIEGIGFVPEFAQEERPNHLLSICREFELFFAGVHARMAEAPFQFLFARHDLLNYHPEHLRLLETIDELDDLRLLRQLFLRFHRRH